MIDSADRPSHEEYVRWGYRHTPQQREAAALAALAILYGTTWDGVDESSSLGMAADRLIAFAGEDTFHDVCDQERLMELPDEPQPELVERGMKALKRAFNWSSAPHSRSTWRKVQSYARKGAR